MTSLFCYILLAAVVVLLAVCLWQRHRIRIKNRALVRYINESIKYKRLYYDALSKKGKSKKE